MLKRIAFSICPSAAKFLNNIFHFVDNMPQTFPIPSQMTDAFIPAHTYTRTHTTHAHTHFIFIKYVLHLLKLNFAVCAQRETLKLFKLSIM